MKEYNLATKQFRFDAISFAQIHGNSKIKESPKLIGKKTENGEKKKESIEKLN